MNSSSRVNIPLFVFRGDCCIKFFSCCRRSKMSSPAKTHQVYGKRTWYGGYRYLLLNSLFTLFCSIFLANNAAPKETRLFTTPLWLRICGVFPEITWLKAFLAMFAGFIPTRRSFQLFRVFSSKTLAAASPFLFRPAIDPVSYNL